MSEKTLTETRKTGRGGEMTFIVHETASMAEFLQEREFRGLGDTRDAARHRVAAKTGVPASYLKRLRYQAGTMTDVLGSVYVQLRTAYLQAIADEERRLAEARALREAIDNAASLADLRALVHDLGSTTPVEPPPARRDPA